MKLYDTEIRKAKWEELKVLHKHMAIVATEALLDWVCWVGGRMGKALREDISTGVLVESALIMVDPHGSHWWKVWKDEQKLNMEIVDLLVDCEYR